MLSTAGSRPLNMPKDNNNKDEIKNSKRISKGSSILKQSFSAATNLPSISNMLISESPKGNRTDDKNLSKDEHFTLHKRGRSVASTGSSLSGNVSFPPSFSTEVVPPIKISKLSPGSNGMHNRTGSLGSLMNTNINIEIYENKLDEKINEFQQIKDRITGKINLLNQNYSSRMHGEETNKIETLEALKELQNSSAQLHCLINELLGSPQVGIQPTMVTSVTPSILPSMNQEIKYNYGATNHNHLSLSQQKRTLLPPLQIKENLSDERRFNAFKFPVFPGDTNPNPNQKISANNPIFESVSQTIQQRPTPQTTTLKTPKKSYISSLSPVSIDSPQQTRTVETGKLNKVGNAFTLFPKSANQKGGRSTIITPVTTSKDRGDSIIKQYSINHDHGYQDRPNDGSMLVIPPLPGFQEEQAITPNSSREENKIITESGDIQLPTNITKKQKINPNSQILTSESGATIGMTKTLKLTSNALLEKPVKKRQSNFEESKQSLIKVTETVHPNQEPTVKENEPPNSDVIENDTDEGEEGIKKCFHCHSFKTPEWRAGPYGGENICNACGLFYRKIIGKFGEKGGNLLMRYRQIVCPKNRRVPAYIEIPEEYMIKFSKEAGFDQFNAQ